MCDSLWGCVCVRECVCVCVCVCVCGLLGTASLPTSPCVLALCAIQILAQCPWPATYASSVKGVDGKLLARQVVAYVDTVVSHVLAPDSPYSTTDRKEYRASVARITLQRLLPPTAPCVSCTGPRLTPVPPPPPITDEAVVSRARRLFPGGATEPMLQAVCSEVRGRCSKQ